MTNRREKVGYNLPQIFGADWFWNGTPQLEECLFFFGSLLDKEDLDPLEIENFSCKLFFPFLCITNSQSFLAGLWVIFSTYKSNVDENQGLEFPVEDSNPQFYDEHFLAISLLFQLMVSLWVPQFKHFFFPRVVSRFVERISGKKTCTMTRHNKSNALNLLQIPKRCSSTGFHLARPRFQQFCWLKFVFSTVITGVMYIPEN